MAHRKLRVLIDLSMAARGYCGIAQDARLLFKTLAACDGVDVTGLIYHPRRFGPRHRFLAARAPLADRLANQAVYLWGLSDARPAWPDVSPMRMLKQAQQIASALCAPRARLEPLEVEAFEDVVWRTIFAQTLSPAERPLVRRGSYLLSSLSDGMIYARTLANLRPFKLDTRGFDYFIVQGPRPFRTSPETRQIVRYYDMIPLLQPDTMSNPLVIQWHKRAIERCRRSAFFACSSEPTRDDLTMLYPELREQSATVSHALADTYYPDPCPEAVEAIIARRRSTSSSGETSWAAQASRRYIMCVSALEPRKNLVGLMHAFRILKGRGGMQNVKMVIVGSPGWKCGPIQAAMRDGIARGDVAHLESVPCDELRVLYSHAEALVFPSFCEGLGFPPLEAMQCGTPVIASDIRAHRWTLGEAALYCNPYDCHSIAAAIEQLFSSPKAKSLRQKLVASGYERVKLYHVDRCAREWTALFDRLGGQNHSAPHSSTAPPSERVSLPRVA